MNRLYTLLIGAVSIAICLVTACNENHTSVKPELQEKIFVVNIVPDSLKLKEYLDHHKRVWPQVEAGFKKAGYKNIVLYRYDYLVVMKITVAAGADLGEMGKLAESYDPRCAEWNRLMATYQTGVPGTSAGQTWVKMEPFYSFNNP